MRKVAQATYGTTLAAGTAYAKAHGAAMQAADLVEAMQHVISLILAAEHLKDMATEAEKSLRSILSTTIAETGADDIVTMHHKAYLARKGAWVSVDQADLIPPAFMTAPIPDKKAIKAALEAGDDVPGCSLVRPNEQTLAIRARK